jgi:hypothetical protein
MIPVFGPVIIVSKLSYLQALSNGIFMLGSDPEISALIFRGGTVYLELTQPSLRKLI